MSVAQQGLAERPSNPAGPLLAAAALVGAAVCLRLAVTSAACSAYGWVRLVRPARSPRPSSACARFAVRLSPRLLRPVVTALVVGGLALGTASTATAAGERSAAPAAVTASAVPNAGTPADVLPGPDWSRSAELHESPHLPAAGWTPRRPAAAPRSLPDLAVLAATAARDAGPAPVVVRRGDSLWSIAARHLGPGASQADVAEQWPRWWQANRSTIGDDPDLLLPGQVLVRPGTAAAR
ncbi:MAG TPA: LysM domain-containing protein [Actinomycetales bacterium]|nr:LysM domain-containing protein [Actinomycetales bacterium]